MSKLPPGTFIRILASHKTGHVVPCVGIARALGVEPELVPMRPGKLLHLLAPWGPADLGFFSVSRPSADIVIGSGKETVPVLRKIKRMSAASVFTVYLGDPRASRNVFDLIWTPEHDSVTGKNVFKTLTAPHPHNLHALQAARENGDGRLASLPSPKVAVLVGGPSGQYPFGLGDADNVCGAIARVLEQGASVMVSPSRRTPAALVQKIKATISQRGADGRAFVWDGSGDNPYVPMLGQADAFIVTSDSVNMIGEALATGKPVHVLQLAGKAGKFAQFYMRLHQGGFIRDWNGTLEDWSYQPLDATADIAAEVARRYAQFGAIKKKVS